MPDGDYAHVIELHTGKKSVPGNFVDTSGKVLGQHRGIIHYTIGQHRWLGIDLPGKRYVCRICPKSNTVVLGTAEELFSREVFAEDFNWISGKAPAAPFRCKAKIRYRQPEQWATVTAIYCAHPSTKCARPSSSSSWRTVPSAAMVKGR